MKKFSLFCFLNFLFMALLFISGRFGYTATIKSAENETGQKTIMEIEEEIKVPIVALKDNATSNPEPLLAEILGTTAYSWNRWQGPPLNPYLTAFDLDTPEVLPNVALFYPSGVNIDAGEYYNGLVYMVDYTNNMWEVDPTTGAILNSYTATPPPDGGRYTSMAVDPTDGTVYAGSYSSNAVQSNLHTIDLATGITTVVGPITNAVAINAMAIDGNGDLYAYDWVLDVVLSVDKATGEGTVLGPSGFNNQSYQGMGWDQATDRLLLTAFDNPNSQATLREVDRTTGNTTILGFLGSSDPGALNQLTWLGIDFSRDFTFSAGPVVQDICAGVDAFYNVVVGSQSGYTETVTLSADGEPDPPGSAVFNPNNQAAPYTSTLTIGTTGAAAGSYPVIISGIGPTQTHTTTVLLDVDSANPGTPTLVVPPDGASGISPLITFKWTAAVQASQYLLEVASDPAFNTVVYTATVLPPDTMHSTAPPLDPDSTYYWRVFATNACGGIVSEVFSFDTGPTFCVSPDISITSGPHISDLVITNARTISDMNVLLNISHTWVGDLLVEIEHLETGTTLTLVDQPGFPNINPTDGCQDNDLVDFILDDESANGPHDDACPDTDITPAYPTGSAWDPVEASLGNFDAENISGTWRLSVTDEYPTADDGILNEWCIIPALEPGAPVINVNPASLYSEQYPNTQVTQTLSLSNTGDADLEWDIFEDATTATACDGSEPIDWVSVSPISGTLPASSEASVAVNFGSVGYSAGIYTGTLCVSSNDGTNPMIPVPLTMTVSVNRTYLPIVVSGPPATASTAPYLVHLLLLPAAISLGSFWAAAKNIRRLSKNPTQIPDSNRSQPP